MSDVPTVKVKHKDGYMIINQSDFDSSKHEVYVEPSEASAQPETESEDPRSRKRK